jgi:hypothetical protein
MVDNLIDIAAALGMSLSRLAAEAEPGLDR